MSSCFLYSFFPQSAGAALNGLSSIDGS